MPRPKLERNILKKPQHQQNNNKLQPIELKIDEYEAIRLKDYHNIQQKKAAQLMHISQPTFHRILQSARKKIATAIIEGKKIKITGDEQMKETITYKCTDCQFQWSKQNEKYTTCPNCNSTNIKTLEKDTNPLNQRKSYGGPGRGKTPPKSCKCPNCGHESPKTRGIPCKNTLCPECGTPLCGSRT